MSVVNFLLNDDSAVGHLILLAYFLLDLFEDCDYFHSMI